MNISIRDERFEQLRAGFRRWLSRSVALLVAAIVITALTYGDSPIFRTNGIQRTAIAIIGGISLIGAMFTGGLLLVEHFLRHYSSAWKRNLIDQKERYEE